MNKILPLILVLIFLSGCASNPPKSSSNPEMFVGTWGYQDNSPISNGYMRYFPNGKKVAVGMFYGSIIAYEATWWVEGEFLFEKIEKYLHSGDEEIPINKMNKDVILKVTQEQLILKELLSDGEEVNVYIRIR